MADLGVTVIIQITTENRTNQLNWKRIRTSQVVQATDGERRTTFIPKNITNMRTAFLPGNVMSMNT